MVCTMDPIENIKARDVVEALRAPCLYSESYKFPGYCDEQVRWLLTLPEETIASQVALTRTKAVLRDVFGPIRSPALPPDHDLVSIHIGLDSTHGRTVRKLYFELSGPSDLVFLATKTGNGMDDTHHYRCITPGSALSRLKLPEPHARAARRILDHTDDKVPTLLVTSERTARVSVDLNFAELCPQDGFEDALYAFLRLFGAWDGGVTTHSAKSLSHLSLGCDDQGAPFLTLYGVPRWLIPSRGRR